MAQTPAVFTLGELLDGMTVEGELYERLAGGKVRCVACGHRCIIFPGRRGICQVRFNDSGSLRVPWGYVAALQCDPTEKKPFNHVLPGSLTLTFGMLGCDYHCPYCLPGETPVITDRGPLTLSDLFRAGWNRVSQPDGEISFPKDTKVVTVSGAIHPVKAVFKHSYRGTLLAIRPFYFPTIRCTPDHRVYATDDPERPPKAIEARKLTTRHYLALPRVIKWSESNRVDVHSMLAHHGTLNRIHWERPLAERLTIAVAAVQGESSRETGRRFGTSASHIRHLRRKIARGLHDFRLARLTINGGLLRFRGEHAPGIPTELPLDPDLAELLGYYCAEGSVTRHQNRPSSLALVFSFGPTEHKLAQRVQHLLRKCLGVEARIRRRETSCTVSVTKTSAAMLFDALAGTGAAGKYVPRQLFGAPGHAVRAFLDAYVRGDGHRYPGGKVTVTTISRDLAYGVALLTMKSGFAPSVYLTPLPVSRILLGRQVNLHPAQYSVFWYEIPRPRKLVETSEHYLIPIRRITAEQFSGHVYNMEVADEHSYLAGLLAVANCQNWLSSQTLRDPAAGQESVLITPQGIMGIAKQRGAQLIGSSYNEPLITSEWALAAFKQAKQAGLRTCYISNGDATPEVLRYLRPWTDCYKIDLKAFNDKNYRFLGGRLESVLRTIKMVYEMGFWTEIVTLVIPGYNDSDDELRAAAEFIASVSPLIPWHVTAFHKDYKMLDPANTSAETLIRAARVGETAGLKYVYAGNLPGRVGRYEHTFCHHCGTLLVERHGYMILQNRLRTTAGRCPNCGTTIPGIWN